MSLIDINFQISTPLLSKSKSLGNDSEEKKNTEIAGFFFLVPFLNNLAL